MGKHAETARQAFNVLMTTGKQRIHPHIYFGLPIKLISIFVTFLDLLFNILPVIFAPPKYRIVFIAVTFCTRIAAFYVVFSPKLKYLNGYRVLLLLSTLGYFGVNVLHVLLLLVDNSCQKLYVKQAFAVAGVLTPVEVICFITISAYAAYIASEEENAAPSAPPPPEPKMDAKMETVQKATTETKPDVTVTTKVNELDQKPLITKENDVDDLD